jgi:hypothetical protein
MEDRTSCFLCVMFCAVPQMVNFSGSLRNFSQLLQYVCIVTLNWKLSVLDLALAFFFYFFKPTLAVGVVESHSLGYRYMH